jgi:GTP-binding protein HflX
VLKERLREVQTGREVMRQARAGEFKASLVGYTNAGKSSVLRGLSGANEVYVEDRLFATLDPLTREVDAGDGMRALLTDTVGFIRKLPHHLVASFRATLEETRDADLLLHVVDGSHSAWEEHWSVVEQVLSELGASDQPTLLVVNKTDLIAEDELLELQAQVRERVPDAVYVSAVSAGGLEPLRRALQAAVRSGRPEAEIEFPASNGKLLAELHRGAEVIEQRLVEDRLLLRARLDEALAGRLRRGGARVTSQPNGPGRPRRG